MKGQTPQFARSLGARLIQVTCWRFRPGIISITGSVGKTTTKAAIAAVLRNKKRVRVSPETGSAECGMLLTFLATSKQQAEAVRWYGEQGTDAKRIWLWVRILIGAIMRIVTQRSNEAPDTYIIEYGKADEVRQLLRIVRPTIAVLTPIGDAVPVDARGSDDPARDYIRTVEQLPASGFAVIPAEEAIANVRQRTRAHVLTYGTGQEAHVKVSTILQEIDVLGTPGVSAEVIYGGSSVPMLIRHAVGPYHATAAAAAICVGVIHGITLQESVLQFEDYQPPRGAIRIQDGVKETVILEDTYDAHLVSTMAGIELLEAYPGKRKILVLGDLIDLGSRSMEVHAYLGHFAREMVDVLITIGSRANIAAESACKAKMPKKNVMSFATAEEAAPIVQALCKKGDVVLITGSRVMHLDQVVDEIRETNEKDREQARQG